MSVRTELRDWGTAFKELWQEQMQKHPIFGWVVLVIAFFSALIESSQYSAGELYKPTMFGCSAMCTRRGWSKSSVGSQWVRERM
jgi:hypothetical protein